MDSLVFAFSRWNDVGSYANIDCKLQTCNSGIFRLNEVGSHANMDCKLHLSLKLKGNLQ